MASDKKTIEISFKEETPQSSPQEISAGQSPSSSGASTPSAIASAAAGSALAQFASSSALADNIAKGLSKGLPQLPASDLPPARELPPSRTPPQFSTSGPTAGPNDRLPFDPSRGTGIGDPFRAFDPSLYPKDMQQTIQQLNQQFQQLSQATQAGATAAQGSARASAGLAGAAQTAAAALGGGGAGGAGGAGGGAAGAGGFFTGAWGGGGGSVTPGMLAGAGLAAAAAGAAAAMAGLVVGGLAFNRTVDEMVEAVGAYSSEVAAASAASRIQEIEDRLRLAREAGGDVAALERTRSDVASELRGIIREGIEIVSTPLAVIGSILKELLGVVRAIMQAINYSIDTVESGVEMVSGFLAHHLGGMPALGPLLKRFDRWMRSNNSIGASNTAHIDALFNWDNIGATDPDFDGDGKPDSGIPRP